MLINNLYEERGILARIAEGDEHAFRILFHHYNSILQPFVQKLTGSGEATEEVLQEVFLKVWLHRARLADVENPKAYIVRIVTNEAVDHLQAAAKKVRLVRRLERLEAPPAPSPEQAYAYRELEYQLQEAVEQLPVACRQVYRMSREQYKCIPEIAAELNLSESTVKNQLVKALKRIRVHLAGTLPGLIAVLLSSR